MLYEEFVNLTGHKPSLEDYKAIEKQYYYFDGDKQAFCRDWIERYNNKRHEIEILLNDLAIARYEKSGKSPEFFALKKILLTAF